MLNIYGQLLKPGISKANLQECLQADYRTGQVEWLLEFQPENKIIISY